MTPAVASADAQHDKHNKYRQLVERSGAQLLVFAYENSGAKSTDALNFLTLLDKWLRNRTPDGFEPNWTARTPGHYVRQCIDIAYWRAKANSHRLSLTAVGRGPMRNIDCGLLRQ